MPCESLSQLIATDVMPIRQKSSSALPPGVVALGARRADAEPFLTGSGFIVHVDAECCILCSCAHILLEVEKAAKEGSALDPLQHGVAIGFGDPVVWHSTASVEHYSPPPNHRLAPPHQPPLHHPQLDLAVLVMATGGIPAEWRVALPIGDSLGVSAGDELVSLLSVTP